MYPFSFLVGPLSWWFAKNINFDSKKLSSEDTLLANVEQVDGCKPVKRQLEDILVPKYSKSFQ
jgi:hypothetical protein